MFLNVIRPGYWIDWVGTSAGRVDRLIKGHSGPDQTDSEPLAGRYWTGRQTSKYNNPILLCE